MRLTTLMFVIVLAHVSTMAHAQITLKEKDAPLEKVLVAIEKQTKFVFLYDPDAIKTAPITISVKDATLEQTLAQLFHNLPIEYTVVDHNILLKAKPVATGPTTTYIPIHGRVVDSTGQPLPGVTVFSKRDKKTTTTDTAGFYSIRGSPGDQLVFTSVGYKDRTIPIAGQPSINLTLELNPSTPDQVVVIGYGTSKKKDLTGAVATVSTQDLGEVPYNTFDNALAGSATGVDVTKTDGTPGGMVRVRIRGSSSLLGGNDPLYVIDGIPLQVRSNFIDPGISVGSPFANLTAGNNTSGNSPALSASFVNGLNGLSGLNPIDIESITILKDASSTAIYGSKAANGVVIITTKKGKANMQPSVALDYNSSITSIYNHPRLLNAAQYKTLITEAARNAADADSVYGMPVDNVSAAVLDSPTFFGAANTNWIKQVTRTVASENIAIAVSGGGQTWDYFNSLSYNNTPGVVDDTKFQRISGKLNLEAQINSKLRFATNLLIGFTNQDIGDGAYPQAILARPDLKPRDASGSYTNFDLQEGATYSYNGLINPVALLTATNNSRTLSLLGSLSVSYDLSKAFHVLSALSINMQGYNQHIYLPSYIDITGNYGNAVNLGGEGSDANSRFADWFLENTLSYTKQFNEKNALNVVIGQSYETTKYSYFTITAAGYPNNNLLTSLSSADTVLSTAGNDPGSPQSYLLSFYTRANYSYLDKYLFTFTGRADGSSKFGPDNKFGYFPSAAVAWRISREDFLGNFNWINNLKLRGSYGLVGNQNIGDQMYRTLFSPVSYVGARGLVPTQLGNAGIKWESSSELDIGLDLSFLRNRLNATADWYNRQTSDALLSLPVASSSSYSTLLQNAVGLRNRGLEVSISGDLVRAGNFRWTASINSTWSRSLVTKLNSAADLSQLTSLSGFESVIGGPLTNLSLYGGNTVLLQGKPLGLIAGYVVTGIIKTQTQLDAYNQQRAGSGIFGLTPERIGDPMYKLDTNVLSQGYGLPAVAQVLGDGAPKYYGGMTQEFTYKSLQLRCNFTFSKGGHLLWAEHAASTEFYATANADVSMLSRYTPANTKTNAPGLDMNVNSGYTPTNLDVFNSSYFKLRSLTLSYQVDQTGWMKRIAIKTCTVFIAATNVFTITKYPGSDPEVSDDPYSVAGGYIDVGNYPSTKTISIGLKTIF